MSYCKQFPIRITFDEEPLKMLIEALKSNEEIFDGSNVADDARALREKIERYGRRETDENGNDVVHLGFYEKEGAKFIWQFIAASIIVADYRELSKMCDMDGAAQMEV